MEMMDVAAIKYQVDTIVHIYESIHVKLIQTNKQTKK